VLGEAVAAHETRSETREAIGESLNSVVLQFTVMSQPWYKDGLRFTCTRCGHCCTGEPGFVWVEDGDLAAIAQERGESLEEVKALYTRWTPQRRLRLLRPRAGMYHLCRAAAAVPHLAVLGEQRRHAGSLATHLQCLPRLRTGRIDFCRRNNSTLKAHQALIDNTLRELVIVLSRLDDPPSRAKLNAADPMPS
jgi:hypothetical protein